MTTTTPPLELPIAPLAVDANALAKMLNVSPRHIRRMNSAGQLPAPARLGKSIRWGLDEIRDWLRAGAPDRAAWEAISGNTSSRRPTG